jgi:hypothetical protein
MTVTEWDDLIAIGPRRRRASKPASARFEPPWAQDVRCGVIDGVEVQVFGIGALAAALRRSTRTIRRWEADGTIPRCELWLPHPDPRGRRRRYTREWIEGLVMIAADEDLLDRKSVPIESTSFPRRAFALRRRLAA